MDPKLAEIYGTNQVTDADIEKLAAAELATQLAGEEYEEEGMTEDDLEAIAQQVLAPAEEYEETETEETEAGDDAQEKVAEADYLGRVMAHAYVQELGNIEKTAMGRGGPADVAHLAGDFPAAHHRPTKMERAKDAVKGAGEKAGKVGKFIGAGFKSGATKGQRAAAAGTALAGTAALAAGAYKGIKAIKGHKANKEKTSAAEELSAVDTLVLARAQEILEASGIDPNSLTEGGQEKVSADETVDPREVLAAEVEQRAWDLLGQYGVVPAETEQE